MGKEKKVLSTTVDTIVSFCWQFHWTNKPGPKLTPNYIHINVFIHFKMKMGI